MLERDESNPLTAGLSQALLPQPCSLVIFGGSGDLAKRKLLPALYNLALDGALPANFAVVGIGRREFDDDIFRGVAREGVESFSRRPLDPKYWPDFERSLFFHRGSIDDAGSYAELKARLEEIEATCGVPGNRVFYLSIPPDRFRTCVEQLRAAGLVTPPAGPGPFRSSASTTIWARRPSRTSW
jgi:glucose-6-phosphate 1-dehydrogenase